MPAGGAWGTFNPYTYQQQHSTGSGYGSNVWSGGQRPSQQQQGGYQQPPMPYAGAGAWGQPQGGGGPRRPQGRGGGGGIGGFGGRSPYGGYGGRSGGRVDMSWEDKQQQRQQNMMQNVGQMQGLFGQMPGYGGAMQDALKWMYAPGWGTEKFPIQQFIGSLTGGWGGDPKGYQITDAPNANPWMGGF